MSIIEHGDWVRYTPDPLPASAPASALFAQRTSDGQDWYNYVNPPAANFQPNSVMMTVYRPGVNGPTVGAAVYDPTMLWSGDMLIIEDTAYAGSDPQGDYGGKIYDPATQTFSDPPPFELPVSSEIKDLTERIAALEARGK